MTYDDKNLGKFSLNQNIDEIEKYAKFILKTMIEIGSDIVWPDQEFWNDLYATF